MNTKYGLPENVIFCKKCVISNQRPSTSPEYKKKSSVVSTIGFSEDGICDACKFTEYKKTIDWEKREAELKALLDRHRRNDGHYDVLVPGSGGKDSFFVSHVLKYQYNMNPLTVTWAPHIYTPIGWKNMQAWIKAGFDNILVTPNAKVHSKLTQLAFKNLVNPFQPFIIGQKLTAPKFALQYNIPLIMYGENQAEAHNSFQENMSPLMNLDHFTLSKEIRDLYMGGIPIDGLKQFGIERKDLSFYIPPNKEEVLKKNIEIHYMSYYHSWSPQKNYYYAKEHSEFESNPDGRSEGTYSKFSSLDDKIDGQHYYTMYIKFGQGRAMNDACRDIRDGYIIRDEALALMKKYDGEFPKKYFQEFLNYINITEEEYWNIIDNARSPHLWEKKNGEWHLKHVVYNEQSLTV